MPTAVAELLREQRGLGFGVDVGESQLMLSVLSRTVDDRYKGLPWFAFSQTSVGAFED